MSPYPGRGYLEPSVTMPQPRGQIRSLAVRDPHMRVPATKRQDVMHAELVGLKKARAGSFKLLIQKVMASCNAAGMDGQRLTARIALFIALVSVFVTLIFAALSGSIYSVVAARLISADMDRKDLRSQVTDWNKALKEQSRAAQAQLTELKSPPSRFAEAENLFTANRYAEAEGAYARFLVENPASRVADVALYHSALANAMLGNCTMITSRFKVLESQFLKSGYTQKYDQVLSSCLLIRAQNQPSKN